MTPSIAAPPAATRDQAASARGLSPHRLRSIRESLGWRRLPAPPCGGSHRPPRRILGRCQSCPKVRPPKLRIKPKSMTHRRIEVPSSETICRTAKNFLAEPVATKVPHCLLFRIIRKGLPLIRKGLPCQALRLIDASRRWRSCPRMSHLGAKAGLRGLNDLAAPRPRTPRASAALLMS